MVTSRSCPNCRTPYEETALYCAECGYILPHALESGVDSTRHVNSLNAEGRDLQWGTSYFHHRARLLLNVLDTDLTIPVSLEKGSAIIGRHSDTEPVDVDLTPFEAATLGVSRCHARIDRVRDTLHVTDLESSNGTYLNRERLTPNVPYTLRNRAVLQLGKLVLRIQFV